MIRGDSFYSLALSQLATSGFTLLADRVDSVDAEGLEVRTSSGRRFRARKKIFNSAEEWSGVRRPARYEIWQHFHGIRIRARKPVFDPGRVHFMDFRTRQDPGVCFLYVLPFSSDEALVEHTVFSRELSSQEFHRARIESYLERILGLAREEYGVLDEESGRIPMSSARYPSARSDSFLNIGTAGGLVKPSTGYTFSRIQRDSRLIQAGLENPARRMQRFRTHARFRYYDELFLNILSESPGEMAAIFSQLFQSNPLPRILRFLDEDSSLLDEVRIFFGLPWRPFLHALWRHAWGSFSS
jgi:lycopene beta-cyclase